MFVLLGVLCFLGISTLWSNDRNIFSVFGNVGVDSLSTAKYAIVGGASRFIDAFESIREGDMSHHHNPYQNVSGGVSGLGPSAGTVGNLGMSGNKLGRTFEQKSADEFIEAEETVGQ